MIAETKMDEDYTIDVDTPFSSGQYSAVYPCRAHADHSKQLCVKVMNISEVNEINLNREIEIWSILSATKNPNIARLEKVYREKDQIKFVMERYNYGDLQKLMKEKQQKNQKFKAEEVFSFIGQIVNGYYELYSRSILHRDLKPANIVIQKTPEGFIYKISDFGMSRMVDSVQDRLCLSKVGSPAYAAPQLFLEDDYSTKSDIYSLGVIVYHMVFGRFPFKGYQMKDILNYFEQLQNQNFICPEIPLEGAPQVKQKLRDLINQMVTREESKRIDWQTLFDLFKKEQNEQMQKKVRKIQIVSVEETVSKDQQPFTLISGHIPEQKPLEQSTSDRRQPLDIPNVIEVIELNCSEFQNPTNDLEYLTKMAAINLQKYQFTRKLYDEICRGNLESLQISELTLQLCLTLLCAYQMSLMGFNKSLLYEENKNNDQVRNLKTSAINKLEKVRCYSNEKYQPSHQKYKDQLNHLVELASKQLATMSHTLKAIVENLKSDNLRYQAGILEWLQQVYVEGKIQAKLESSINEKKQYRLLQLLFKKMVNLDKLYPLTSFMKMNLTDIDYLPQIS